MKNHKNITTKPKIIKNKNQTMTISAIYQFFIVILRTVQL
jgi:hypothetical protein